MPGRVEQHPPGIARLIRRHRRPEGDGSVLGGVNVVNRKIEVELLIALLVGPAGRLVALNPAKPKA